MSTAQDIARKRNYAKFKVSGMMYTTKSILDRDKNVLCWEEERELKRIVSILELILRNWSPTIRINKI